MMSIQFAVAAALSLTAAGIHGIVGEAVVVTRLRPEELRPTKFGGGSMTKLLIRATWHVTTLAFIVPGIAMAACTPAASSRTCDGVGLMAAISFTCFGIATLAMGWAAAGPRALRRHPGPLVFVLVAALAWWGWAS